MFSQNASERRTMLATARAVLAFSGDEVKRREAFPCFYESHPKLFNIICSGRGDLGYLETMLNRMDDIEAGSSTVEQASAEISGQLNKNYIENVIPPPTAAQASKPGEAPTINVVECPCPEAVLISKPTPQLHTSECSKKGVKRAHERQ